MPTGVKLTLIGAGSATFAATIVRDLCVTEGLRGSHMTLMDIDAQRLKMTHRLATRLVEELGADLEFAMTTDREEALRGADFVLNTAQVGGHDWTEAQRALAERHGYYRGARLHNYGQAAFHLEVARDVERFSPNAWLIQSANPVFEACTLMSRETSVKVLGLCHGHYGYRKIAEVLGLEREHVSAQAPGFNHWIWMTHFLYKGQDAYALIDKWVENEAEAYWAKDDRRYSDTQMSRAAIDQYRLFGLMPIGDTPRFGAWWQHTDLATKQHWYGQLGGFDSEIGWGQYLENVRRRAEVVAEVATDASRRVTETFPPQRSDEQIVPIIDSLVNDVEAIYQVNIPNRGPLLKGFPEDLVVEVKGVVNSAGIRGVSVPPLPRKLMVSAMIPRWSEAELFVEALRSGDPDVMLHSLMADPRTRSLDQAKALMDEWLADPRNGRLTRLFGG
jgi:alpha-galactosidase